MSPETQKRGITDPKEVLACAKILKKVLSTLSKREFNTFFSIMLV